MGWLDLAWLLPLMAAVSVVVGASGRPEGELGPSIRNTFLALTAGVVVVGALVHLVVLLFA